MARAASLFLLASAVCVPRVASAQSPAIWSITPDLVKWAQHPALPEGAERAVVYGDPTKSGPYATRLHSPQGIRVMPHTHPEDRIYTVLSGTLYLGIGDTFDEAKLKAFPQGSVIYLPAKLSHFQYARADGYVIQINAIGPTEITFIKPSDDLRRR